MGLPLMYEFLVVLWIMSWRASFKGDRGKAPTYATSCRDDSFDEEIASTGEQAAQVLHSHFDCGDDDPGLPAVYPWRPVPRDDGQLRQPVSPLSPVLLLAGLFHGVGQLEGREPPEERCKLRTSL